jgi:hypothetical protein
MTEALKNPDLWIPITKFFKSTSETQSQRPQDFLNSSFIKGDIDKICSSGMHNYKITPEEDARIKQNYDNLRKEQMSSVSGQSLQLFWDVKSAVKVSESERRETFEYAWKEHGGLFLLTFRDVITNEKSNKLAADFVR